MFIKTILTIFLHVVQLDGNWTSGVDAGDELDVHAGDELDVHLLLGVQFADVGEGFITGVLRTQWSAYRRRTRWRRWTKVSEEEVDILDVYGILQQFWGNFSRIANSEIDILQDFWGNFSGIANSEIDLLQDVLNWGYREWSIQLFCGRDEVTEQILELFCGRFSAAEIEVLQMTSSFLFKKFRGNFSKIVIFKIDFL